LKLFLPRAPNQKIYIVNLMKSLSLANWWNKLSEDQLSFTRMRRKSLKAAPCLHRNSNANGERAVPSPSGQDKGDLHVEKVSFSLLCVPTSSGPCSPNTPSHEGGNWSALGQQLMVTGEPSAQNWPSTPSACAQDSETIKRSLEIAEDLDTWLEEEIAECSRHTS
jgi:hypothetical protein